jgi:hypothetical protein
VPVGQANCIPRYLVRAPCTDICRAVLCSRAQVKAWVVLLGTTELTAGSPGNTVYSTAVLPQKLHAGWWHDYIIMHARLSAHGLQRKDS